MFTRIHTVRFQNQLAKEAMRDKFVSIVDGFFAEGLLLTQFVDIDETTLFFINLWRSKSDSERIHHCLLYTSPSPRDRTRSRMPSSA